MRGGNRDFHFGDKYLTSNEAFYGRSASTGKRSTPVASRPGSAMSTPRDGGAIDRMSVTDAISTAIF